MVDRLEVSLRIRYVISSILTSQQRRVPYERFPNRTKLKSREAAGRDRLTSPRPEHDSGRCSSLLPAVCVCDICRRGVRNVTTAIGHHRRVERLNSVWPLKKQTDLEVSLSLCFYSGLEVQTYWEILAQTQKLKPGSKAELLKMWCLAKVFTPLRLLHFPTFHPQELMCFNCCFYNPEPTQSDA